MVHLLLLLLLLLLLVISTTTQHVGNTALICLVKELDVLMADHTSKHEYRCVVEADDSSEESDMSYSLDLPDLTGPNVYATIPNAYTNQKGQVVVPNGATVQYSAQRPVDNNYLAPQGGLRHRREPRVGRSGGRQLTIRKEGTSTVLVLRISSRDSEPTLTGAQLSDRVFGTDGDRINFKSIYDHCSYGKLIFIPAAGADIVDGVGELSVSESFAGRSSLELENAVTTAANAKFGTMSTTFDHVMYCFPPGTEGSWLAYAYVGWYRSVYNDEWCGYPSALAHELGHNLEMQHSNEDGVEYGDQSGLMGFSYGISDGPEMCFNGAKSSFLGWYSDREIIVNPTNGAWVGELVGAAHYQSSSSTQYLIATIELKDSRGTVGALYLIYNRATGINVGTQEKANQVTVTQTASLTGVSSSLAGLDNDNPTYIHSNYDGNNNNLSIDFCGAVTSSIPNFAKISVFITGQSSRCNQESAPRDVSTSEPAQAPTSEPTENSTENPTPGPTAPPRSFPTAVPTPSRMLVPTTLPTSPPITLLTPPPTLQPVSAPTTSPTSPPTSTPTSAPVSSLPPSASETPSPTQSPIASAPSEDTSGRDLDCSSNQKLLQVTIRTDDYASENRWILVDGSGQTVVSGGPYELPHTEYQYGKCIENSVYIFRITDEYGDGLCCENGQGSYSVVVNAVEVQSGGEFGHVEEATILPDCVSGTALLAIEVETDYFGAETTWELKTSLGTPVLSGGDYGSQQEYMKTVCVSESECYTFTIFDEWGDGICCSYGFGNYKITYLGNEYISDFTDGKEESLTLGSCTGAAQSTHGTYASTRGTNRRRRRKAHAPPPSRPIEFAFSSRNTPSVNRSTRKPDKDPRQ